VNNTWFQRSFDTQYLGRPEETVEDAHAARNLRFVASLTASKPKRVLVLGSGLGNDTAVALKYGAEHVDAVDIDAGIVSLSEAFHPNKPYRDPRVTVHIDDARHYLSYTSEKYDLVLLGVLEARSLFSQFSNLRLDNYVYTVEGIKSASMRLNPDGILWLNMWVPRPWLLDKLDGVMREVFADRYAIFHGTGSEHYALVGGPSLDPVQLTRAVAGIPAVEPVPATRRRDALVTVPVDDWPYIFYRTRQIPLSYLGLLTLLVVLSVAPLRMARRDLFRVRWSFFFLGAAFLLVEASAVVRMALVAGTTWTVNSSVFAGVLCFAFLSNWIVARWNVTSLKWVFAALAVSLVGSYLFPFHRLLALPPTSATVACAVVLTLPVLFSGVVFSALLRDETEPSRALASNLFGAIFGGFAEYLSMMAGNRAMALLALCLYVTAYWLTLRRRTVWAVNMRPALYQ
jgi:SAM-dependent methyltransferase